MHKFKYKHMYILLLHYKKTPENTSGKSPGELLFNCKINTRFIKKFIEQTKFKTRRKSYRILYLKEVENVYTRRHYLVL